VSVIRRTTWARPRGPQDLPHGPRGALLALAAAVMAVGIIAAVSTTSAPRTGGGPRAAGRPAMGRPAQARRGAGRAASRPNIVSGRPNIASGRPNIASGQPNIASGQPNIASGQPNIASGQPNIASGQPNIVSGQPNIVSGRPNIVFVLTDDLSMDLIPYMPAVGALQARGLTFTNYFVSDSLCCPSRSSIFTGNFPHDTGVFKNSGPGGGIAAFYSHGDENRTFNLALQRAGYRTAIMGKYLNGYLEQGRSAIPPTEVPPGWSQWDVAGWGYPEFDYPLDVNGIVEHFGHRPRDYLTDVIARRGVRFIDRSAAVGKPFFLELATFAPHSPYTPAPRDAQEFSGLTAPRPPNFDVMPTNAPGWLAPHPPLDTQQITRIDTVFRQRAQAVQAVDDMIAKVQAALQRDDLLDDTYIVFSSDNGLHTGEYRLMPGKLTAFDTDIHVPLVIAGPGVPAGSSTDAMTENVDLAKTFAAMGATTLPSDGHSLVPLLSGATPAGWRGAILVEHHGPAESSSDPDSQNRLSGNPPSYEAMRTPGFLYVEYKDGEREFYDLRTDPYELDNIVADVSQSQLALLHAELLGLERCHGGAQCWAAAHVADTPNLPNTNR
jgi:N-acetylglucosamine-6-sulfatase